MHAVLNIKNESTLLLKQIDPVSKSTRPIVPCISIICLPSSMCNFYATNTYYIIKIIIFVIKR